MARRGGLQEVELLDEHAEPPSSPRSRRRVPRVVVVGALVVAVGLLSAQWVITARERAAVEVLAQVPGVLAPVDETLTVQQRVAAEDAGELFGRSDGFLDRAADGSQSYTWSDGDGGPGWTAELLGPSAGLAPVASWQVVSGSTCVSDSAPSTDPVPATRVVCLVSDGAFVVDPTTGTDLERLPATTREVVVLSAADGAVLARWPVDAGEYLAVLPDDVVVLGSWSATAVTLAGYDALTGERRWTRDDPLPGGFRSSDDDHLAISLVRVGDLLGYSGPERSLVLLSPDGRTVRDLDDKLGGMVDAGWMIDEDGRITLQSRDGDVPRTTFLAPDGDPAGDVTVDGRLVHPVLDDDSVPGLLLTADADLRAWDERTGTARWTSDEVVSAQSSLVMRGRVFVTTAQGVAALDARTGATIWTAETERRMTVSSIATDAHHLLVLLAPTSPDGEAVVVAYDPVTGQEEFRAPFPDGISMVGPARRTLVGMDETTNEYVVLG